MAESSLSISYEQLQKEVGYVLGFGLDTREWNDQEYMLADRYIQSGLRMFYSPAAINGHSHQWSFMRPIAEMETVAPYATGTVTVVDGVVTLAGGTFPSWAANGDLSVASRIYSIASRDGDTQVTLDDLTVDVTAGATYELRRYAYDLPDDWAGVDGPLTFQPGANDFRKSIKIVSEILIRQWRQHDSYSSFPRTAATRVRSHEATVGTRYEILFFPAPDDVYAIQYRYKAAPNDLSKTNKYPLGGQPHAETIKAACLAVVERESDEVNGPRQAYYMERLQTSIDIDQRENSPKFLGKNLDRSDEIMVSDSRYDTNQITPYNGYYPGS